MVHQQQSTPADPDAVLRALADPHRREILRLVQRAELPAGLIAANFSRRLYSLRHEALEPVRLLLSEFWPDALGRLKTAVETADPRPPTRKS